MGLMDKFKNLFTDEEIIEEDDEEVVEIKEVKKEEPKLPTFMREKIAKEEKKAKNEEQQPKKMELPQIMKVEQNSNNEIEKEIKIEYNLIDDVSIEKREEPKSSFKFPIDLNDNDFTNSRASRQSLHAPERKIKSSSNVLNMNEKISINSREKIEQKEKKPISQKNPKNDLKVAELYKDKKVPDDKKIRHFKATPIISPIYGVLDKNYNSTEVENNVGLNFENSRPSKNVDFDSVRKKAYGSLTDEIKENLMCENCEYLKEAKECQRRQEQKNEKKKCKKQDKLTEQNYKMMDSDNQYYNDLDNDNHSYQDITLDEAAENYYDYGVEYEKKYIQNYDENYNNSANLEDDEKYLSSYNNNNVSEEIDENENLEQFYLENEETTEVPISNHIEESPLQRKNEIPPVKSSINLLSTLKKSMGEESVELPKIEIPKKEEKNLELTDDLFNLIDSMYDERNDNE